MAVPELHFFAANDVNGATILEVPVTEDYFERLAVRPALTELGFLRFQFSRQVGFAIFDSGGFQPEVFVRLLVPEVSTTRYLWGAFLDDRVQQLVARIKAGENFMIGGPGPKYYLARAALFPEQFTGTGWNIDRANGVFRWKETATAGRVLNRIIDEAHANTTVDAIPGLTTSFGDTLDSAGNAWTNDIAGSDEFEMPIGQSLLEDLFALEMDSALETTIFLGTVAEPRLRLDAWQSYGRDLTGPIGASTVHFKEAVNILGDLSVRGSGRRKASHVIVHGIEGAYVVVERPSWDPGEYAKVAMLESGLDTKSQPLLGRIGLRWLQHQDNGENEILIPHRPGFSQASGLYFPSMPEGSGHYWIGDTVDLTTGGDAGGTWTPLDYRSEAQRVMAITMEMAQVVKDGNATERALSWHLVAELNVERNSDAGPQGGGTTGKAGCNCLKLCSPRSYGVEVTSSAGLPIFGVTRVEFGYVELDGTHVVLFDSPTDSAPFTAAVNVPIDRWFIRTEGIVATHYSNEPGWCVITSVDADTVQQGWEWTELTPFHPGADYNDTFVEITASGCDHGALTGAGTVAAGAGHSHNVLHDYQPTVNDDSSAGYPVGTIWIDTATGISYVLTDNTVGAAVWDELSTAVPGHGDLTGLADDDHSAYETVIAGGGGTISTHGNMGSTETIDPAAGNDHTGTLTADCTITLTSPTNGVRCSIELWVTQDGTGGWDIIWPGSVEWPDGTDPSPDGTASALTRYILETLNGGTTWFGVKVGGGGAVGALDDLSDVTVTSPVAADRLRYDGAEWVNSNLHWEPMTDYDGLVMIDSGGGLHMHEVSH